MELSFKRLRPEAQLPDAQHPGDAGLDLRSAVEVVVGPGERAMIPTGVAVAIPDGHAGLVLPRSGLAAKQGLTMANSPGLIDAGYRGEVICATVNLDRETAVEVHVGDRIAQLVIVALPSVAPDVGRRAAGHRPRRRRVRLHGDVVISARNVWRTVPPRSKLSARRSDGRWKPTSRWRFATIPGRSRSSPRRTSKSLGTCN